jgi:hypothetical protein
MEERFQVVAVDAGNADKVATIFRVLYGEDFPVRDVYQPEVLWREIEAGRLAAALAIDGAKRPVGYISFFTPSPNPRLWEAGNLLVDPDYAHTNVAGMLTGFYFNPQHSELQNCDGIFSQAVCCHYYTQVSGNKAGMVDCALELDLLDGASFKDGKSNKAGMARVSCVLSFKELSNPEVSPQYLPVRYEEKLRQLAAPLRLRIFLPSTKELPHSGNTIYVDKYYEFAKSWKVAVPSIGSDWPEVAASIVAEAKRRGVASLQLVLNTACPSIGAAIEILRTKGFFFGGLAPRWFGADGLLLQQLFDSEPDYENTKLYSPEAKELMVFIRADKETVATEMARWHDI